MIEIERVDPLKRYKQLLDDFHKEFKDHDQIFQYNGRIQHWQKAAVDYATLGIKSCAILNGGALIALPAIIQAFHFESNLGIVLAGIAFSIGIICSLVCLLLAYFSVSASLAEAEYDRDEGYIRISHTHFSAHYPEIYGEDSKKDIAEAAKSAQKSRVHAWRFELAAITLFLASVCFLTLGCGAMLYTAMNNIH
jgi:hypothetical protein